MRDARTRKIQERLEGLYDSIALSAQNVLLNPVGSDVRGFLTAMKNEFEGPRRNLAVPSTLEALANALGSNLDERQRAIQLAQAVVRDRDKLKAVLAKLNPQARAVEGASPN